MGQGNLADRFRSLDTDRVTKLFSMRALARWKRRRARQLSLPSNVRAVLSPSTCLNNTASWNSCSSISFAPGKAMTLASAIFCEREFTRLQRSRVIVDTDTEHGTSRRQRRRHSLGERNEAFLFRRLARPCVPIHQSYRRWPSSGLILFGKESVDAHIEFVRADDC